MKSLCKQTLFALLSISSTDALSSSVETANMAKLELQQSLSSIANKMTLSPEIIIPEPTDPTALLLQSTEVTKMSTNVRTRAKGNAAFIAGSLNSLKTFCTEQETARGNFPGPLPVIYCTSSFGGDASMSEISDAGARGVMYTVNPNNEVASPEELENDDSLKISFDSALENGMQLIPEIILKPESTWDADAVTKLVDSVISQCGTEPPALILTVGAISDEEEEEEEAEVALSQKTNLSLPEVPKELSKKIPILGSVRAVAGGGRMGASVDAHKQAGFKGCLLRCECLPGYRMNPDLDFVGGFWGAAIGDLKSTKSKNFNFRSTIALDRDIPLEWYNYQKDIMESGALGSPGGPGEGDPLNSDNGDYQGF
uniref:Fructose-bisphosphate aldolase n=1 Tax=Chaetoceros debilis TaxID=122233 RepID=A0A7S3QIL6_9STRA|eukprot:CAMPEP_0194074304 /NCGR_PEP_ID=MMETSP0149-20130528/1453_1 /TAXON_ID=122233 /ORGANISM="Chaetoceros debilis, Strain MM31A-1" /LENGTH=369 /DNA_ID=CAMNT_0038754457 /DNA_START=41 /DNA_END=1150 /DNA_ORIENTATION=-